MKKNPVHNSKRVGNVQKASPSFECVSGVLKSFNASKAYDMMMKAEAEYMESSKKD
ncbi:MAG: hypothetical protein ACI4OW_01325 [Alphaproteobacteria bacterium]